MRGLQVTRTAEDEFGIGGFAYSLDDAISHLESHGSKRSGGVDYDNVAFLMINPKAPSKVISTHQVRNRGDHQKLLQTAFKKRCVLYYASVEKKDGKHYAVEPWLVDFDSVDALYDEKGKPKVKLGSKSSKPEKTGKGGLFCPYCDHTINSTPGRTLHVKSKHPDKIEEYQEWLKLHGKS